jgi:hypothetical protein
LSSEPFLPSLVIEPQPFQEDSGTSSQFEVDSWFTWVRGVVEYKVFVMYLESGRKLFDNLIDEQGCDAI